MKNIIAIKKKVMIIGVFLLLITILLTGCFDDFPGFDIGDDLIEANSSITGRIMTTLDGEMIDFRGLIVLENSNGEVTRVYNELKEEKFKLRNLKADNYELKIYNLDGNPINKTLVLGPDENVDLGDIVVESQKLEDDDLNAMLYIRVNLENIEEKAFFNEDIRRAFAYSMDLEAIADIHRNFRDTVVKARRITTPAFIGNYNEDDLTLSNNIEEAKEIMSNFDKVQEIDLYYPANTDLLNDIAQVIKSGVDDIDNLKVNLNAIPFEDTLEKENYIIGYNFGDFKSPLLSYSHLINLREEHVYYYNKAKMNLDDKNLALEYIYKYEKALLDDVMIIPLTHLRNN